MVNFPEHIYIEDNVSINRNGIFFLVHEKIFIGKNTMIGPIVTIITVNHNYQAESLKAQRSPCTLAGKNRGQCVDRG